jgi:S-adenosylmethionine decarboxylase
MKNDMADYDGAGQAPAAPHPYLPGLHVLLDLFDACGLADQAGIEATLRAAARACGATVLDMRLHQFEQGGGVTGVALLAESHISIHTWPETGFAAVDIFMCGACDSRLAVAPLRDYFTPGRIDIKTIARG